MTRTDAGHAPASAFLWSSFALLIVLLDAMVFMHDALHPNNLTAASGYAMITTMATMLAAAALEDSTFSIEINVSTP